LPPGKVALELLRFAPCGAVLPGPGISARHERAGGVPAGPPTRADLGKLSAAALVPG